MTAITALNPNMQVGYRPVKNDFPAKSRPETAGVTKDQTDFKTVSNGKAAVGLTFTEVSKGAGVGAATGAIASTAYLVLNSGLKLPKAKELPILLGMVVAPSAVAGLVGGTAARYSDSLGGSVGLGAASGIAAAAVVGVGLTLMSGPTPGSNFLKTAATLALPYMALTIPMGAIAGGAEHMILDKKK